MNKSPEILGSYWLTQRAKAKETKRQGKIYKGATQNGVCYQLRRISAIAPVPGSIKLSIINDIQALDTPTNLSDNE